MRISGNFLSNNISSTSVIEVVFSMIDDAYPLFDAVTDPTSVAVGRRCNNKVMREKEGNAATVKYAAWTLEH